MDFINFYRNTRLWKTKAYHHIILEIILNDQGSLYKQQRTIHKEEETSKWFYWSLLVLTYFLCFVMRLFLLPWDFLFSRETFFFSVRLLFAARLLLLPCLLFLLFWFFLSLEFFFCGEAFYFHARLLISPWDCLFPCEIFYFQWDFLFPRETSCFTLENVSPEDYFTQSENFWSAIQEGFGSLRTYA